MGPPPRRGASFRSSISWSWLPWLLKCFSYILWNNLYFLVSYSCVPNVSSVFLHVRRMRFHEVLLYRVPPITGYDTLFKTLFRFDPRAHVATHCALNMSSVDRLFDNYFNICLIAQLATTSAAGSLRRSLVSEQKARPKYIHAHMHKFQIKFKM